MEDLGHAVYNMFVSAYYMPDFDFSTVLLVRLMDGELGASKILKPNVIRQACEPGIEYVASFDIVISGIDDTHNGSFAEFISMYRILADKVVGENGIYTIKKPYKYLSVTIWFRLIDKEGKLEYMKVAYNGDESKSYLLVDPRQKKERFYGTGLLGDLAQQLKYTKETITAHQLLK